MLTKLRIQNFKCLRDTGVLDIRPLTFLVGPNSSGKSSLMQVLLMLRQTALATDMESPLTTSGPLVEVGAYPEFIFRHEAHRTLDVQTEWSPVAPIPGELTFGASFCYDASTTRIQLQRTEFASHDVKERATRDPATGVLNAVVDYKEAGAWKSIKLANVKPVKYMFRYADAGGLSRSGASPGTGNLIPPHPGVNWHLLRMAHVGPLREPTRRAYVMSGQAPDHVGAWGEQVVQVLWAASMSKDERERRFLPEVAHWLERLGRAGGLRLERLGETGLFSVRVTDTRSGLGVNLADVGFGVSQVLPVVAQCLHPLHDRTILIEQPEIHLHPAAQSELGDLFIETVSGPGRAVIVETHSEHILSRVCRRIAEREQGISREQVAIYYFKPTPEGTAVEEVTLNESGQYVNFPEGFFEEGFEEAYAHLEAMSKHAR